MSSQKTFPWEIGTPIFPIDYTKRSYCKSRQTPRVTDDQVTHYITSQPWFEKLMDLFESGISDEDKEDRNTKNYAKTIPLELVPMINALMETVCSAEKKRFKILFPEKESALWNDIETETLSDTKKQEIDKLAKDFLFELAKQIHIGIQFNGEIPFDSFFAKQFYRNEFMNGQVLKYMWDRYISPRYKTILELLPNAEAITQANVLSELLFSMDKVIHSLQNCVSKHDQPDQHLKSFDHQTLNNDLFDLSSSFLAPRLKMKKGYNYYVPKIELDNGGKSVDLESAFLSLQRQPNKDVNSREGTLMDNARNAYLHYLDGTEDYSDFQLRILGIEYYLVTTIDKSERDQFNALVRKVFTLELASYYDMVYSDVSEELSPYRTQLLEVGYLGSLVYSRIQTEIQKISNKYLEIYLDVVSSERANSIHTIYGNIESVINKIHSTKDNPASLFDVFFSLFPTSGGKNVFQNSYEYTKIFFRELCFLWRDIFADDEEIADRLPDENALHNNTESYILSQKQISLLVNVQTHARSHVKKRHRLPIDDELSAEDLKMCYRVYNSIIENPDSPFPMRLVDYYFASIIKTFYFIAVGTEAERVIPKLMDFSSYSVDMYSAE